MLVTIADLLNQYANLFLVAVTTVYVVFTWGMVREMRATREAEHRPVLCVSIVPLGPTYAKLQIENAGLGSALDISAIISVIPNRPEMRREWRYSALGVGGKQTFLMPDDDRTGQLPTLTQLMEKYDSVAVKISWKDSSKKSYEDSYQFVLSAVADGWYKAGALRGPEEFLEQFEKLVKNVDSIGKEIKDVKKEMRSERYRQTLLADGNDSAQELTTSNG